MSYAEERIRLKAEAALRDAWGTARIIHELVLRQGGCRIDLAAVTDDRLIVVEVKSERDVLSRLRGQREAAREVADGFTVVLTDKHWRKAWEEGHVCITEAALENDVGAVLRYSQRSVYEATCNAPARLNMLWATELRVVAGTRGNRSDAIRHASDNLTGAEVRRRVCAAIRAREFPRADPPVLCEMFPTATRFHA